MKSFIYWWCSELLWFLESLKSYPDQNHRFNTEGKTWHQSWKSFCQAELLRMCSFLIPYNSSLSHWVFLKSYKLPEHYTISDIENIFLILAKNSFMPYRNYFNHLQLKKMVLNTCLKKCRLHRMGLVKTRLYLSKVAMLMSFTRYFSFDFEYRTRAVPRVGENLWTSCYSYCVSLTWRKTQRTRRGSIQLLREPAEVTSRSSFPRTQLTPSAQ